NLTRTTNLETKTASMTLETVNGQPTVRFTGVNLQVVSGSGLTDGIVNGKGNLIVGYNELNPNYSDKTGSHNIVVGTKHNYSSFGGLVVGEMNTISGEYSSISGGRVGVASGKYSSIAGGNTNTASGWDAAVIGGQFNNAQGNSSAIIGGQSNITHSSTTWTTIAGGQSQGAFNDYQVVSPITVYYQNILNLPTFSSVATTGSYNDLVNKPTTITTAQADAITNNTTNITSLQTRATNLEAKTASMTLETVNGYPTVRFTGVNLQVVSGSGSTDGAVNGKGNLIVGYNEARNSDSNKTGSHNIVVGNYHNYSSFGGAVFGCYNGIIGNYSSVIGGSNNTTIGISSSISGGVFNISSGKYSSISGGFFNVSPGEFSSVSGGYNRAASGENDWVAGGLFQDY
ncbi:hypothetical protein JXR93_09010, partial [bacterium]|nr:hypothetical protein [bacterium]